MGVSEFQWDPVKNERLKRARKVGFEEILGARLVAIEDHPSREGQKKMIFEYANYMWVVPFVEAEEHIFLKTIYPSRKYTKKYHGGTPQ